MGPDLHPRPRPHSPLLALALTLLALTLDLATTLASALALTPPSPSPGRRGGRHLRHRAAPARRRPAGDGAPPAALARAGAPQPGQLRAVPTRRTAAGSRGPKRPRLAAGHAATASVSEVGAGFCRLLGGLLDGWLALRRRSAACPPLHAHPCTPTLACPTSSNRLSTIQAQDAGACLAAFYRQALRKATVELPVEFRQGGTARGTVN